MITTSMVNVKKYLIGAISMFKSDKLTNAD